ncbi:MAG: hypothetical protein IMW92_04645 [Bacillales bacterium]|nr:hypothetical protein [Bacillales bacterium]
MEIGTESFFVRNESDAREQVLKKERGQKEMKEMSRSAAQRMCNAAVAVSKAYKGRRKMKKDERILGCGEKHSESI